MISNYYILHKIAGEIAQKVVGVQFIDAYSMRADELRLRFENCTIVAILKPLQGTVFLQGGAEQRPHQNTTAFFTPLQGKKLVDSRIADHDRIIHLIFEDQLEIVLQFFAPANAVLQTVGESTPVESFKKLRNEQSKSKRELTSDSKSLSIIARYPMLGKKLEQEIASIIGVSDARQPLTAEQLPQTDAIVERLSHTSNAYLYRGSDGSVLLSPLELQSSTDEYEVFSDPSEAVRITVATRAKYQRLHSRRHSVLQEINSYLRRTESALEDLEKGRQSSARAERYTLIADHLKQYGYAIERGTEKLLMDLHGKQTDVMLDPLLTPFENAAKYYERAKKAREDLAGLGHKEERLRSELTHLQKLKEEVEQSSEVKSIDLLEKQLHHLASKSSLTVTKSASNDATAKFREFYVHGKYKVLIGKNAKQNDELTLHTAKKEDLWLHARGVAGSHVVLQVPNKNTSIPKEAIYEAAQLAAYFSDARTQTVAPVTYTKKKFVRKAKGGVPGAVIVEREEVVLVKPELKGREA